MITGLFETHILVSSLDTSMHFYGTVLGLELGRFETERRVAFYWLGERGKAMLGLWETPDAPIRPQHYAFESTIEAVTQQSVRYLQDRGLSPYNFLRQGRGEPMVFGWMPAVSIYFRDPDGHELEFIAMLPDPPQPELGVVSYAAWNQQRQQIHDLPIPNQPTTKNLS
ncbi:VOC family protein [Spirosoma montaniterrae]|uniref:Glyoxalase n=1 Tax=Spirosoma montaniterrae TaxID=1178516 RepID=A0A1P9WYM0_9BACT|nr:VOC family protein [Spirosoma montaniterrae]AQG80476.1 glyoxalase [Spirosoma montaniterrae]